MITPQRYAQFAREELVLAREFAARGDTIVAAYYRSRATGHIKAGKQLRSIKLQSEMWGRLFDSCFGRR